MGSNPEDKSEVLTLMDGKYTFIRKDNREGGLDCLRYGEHWEAWDNHYNNSINALFDFACEQAIANNKLQATLTDIARMTRYQYRAETLKRKILWRIKKVFS